MSVLTSGRREPCKDNRGGIKEIWLTEFVQYNRNVIQGYRSMVVTGFPTTLMFKYEGQEKTFDETLDDDFYNQSISFRLGKQGLEANENLSILLKKNVRAVIVDRLGNIRVAGLHNGLDVEVTAMAGGARGDFNGYEVSLSGMEEFSAPYILSFPGSGFKKEDVTYDCLLASSDKPSSLSDKVSSCNVVQELSDRVVESDCLLASSSYKGSTNKIGSECNI